MLDTHTQKHTRTHTKARAKRSEDASSRGPRPAPRRTPLRSAPLRSGNLFVLLSEELSAAVHLARVAPSNTQKQTRNKNSCVSFFPQNPNKACNEMSAGAHSDKTKTRQHTLRERKPRRRSPPRPAPRFQDDDHDSLATTNSCCFFKNMTHLSKKKKKGARPPLGAALVSPRPVSLRAVSLSRALSLSRAPTPDRWLLQVLAYNER